MATLVRAFAYAGIQQIAAIGDMQRSTDSVRVAVEPYLWRGISDDLDDGGAHPIGPADTNNKINCIRVEIPDGKVIGIEVVSPANPDAVADANSPRISGKELLFFRGGWSLSVIDLTTVD